MQLSLREFQKQIPVKKHSFSLKKNLYFINKTNCIVCVYERQIETILFYEK